MGDKIHPRRRILACILLFALLITGVKPAAVAASETGEAENLHQVIRVGYFAFDGYHMESEDGIRSGYGYEFLQMLARYNNWVYEYVGYDKSWAEMQEMLANGEIDMLTSAQKTREREENFDFSEKSIGNSSVIFTTRSGNVEMSVGDSATYDGVRVGMLTGNSRNKTFAEYAVQKGFTYEPVYYESTEVMISDLKEGSRIDAIVTSDLRSTDGEVILEEFGSSEFYAIVKAGNSELMEQINNGISQMDINSPGWRTSLHNKYYKASSGSNISFTKAELEYLQELESSQKVFRVAMNPTLEPYSYYQNGQPRGIAADIFQELASRLGIQYEFVVTDTYQEYHDLIMNQEVDIDLTCFMDYSLAEEYNLTLTDSYMTTAMARLTRDGSSGEIRKAAMLTDSAFQTTYTETLLADVEYTEYQTVPECLEAIASGVVDGMYIYSYTAQQLANHDERNRFQVAVIPELTVDLAIGVSKKNDYRLGILLHKGVINIKSTYAQQAIQRETALINTNDSMVAFVYDHPVWAISGSVIILGLVFVLILLCILIHTRRREKSQSMELSRFMSYVCEANDSVMEVNLDSKRCRRHYMQNGKLVSTEEPYLFAEQGNYGSYVEPEDYQRLNQEMTEVDIEQMIHHEGGGKYFEARVKDPGGEYKWCSYSLRAIPKSKEYPNNFILFKKDIQSAKEQEEKQRRTLEDALDNAKNASAAKGQFLSRMSHEIRTPLNAVIGYMDIARESKNQPDKVMHCIENCDQAAKHLLSIINDVLDISSIESGRMKIANADFDLKKQISGITTIFFNQAKAKGVKFDVVLQDVTEEWVNGDSLRVNQILMNLLSNAVKFTPEKGQITMTISQMNSDEKKVFMKFEIQDTGIGMSEEYQKKLFTPFEQESALTAQKYGGSGLGLSITYNLIQMMGGSIDVKSKLGEGTTFVVSLHFARSSQKNAQALETQDYSKIRALVVDDEESNCDYIKALLKRCGIKSDFVLSGEDAIRQIRRRMGGSYAYDMCIMDWNMPDMDGVETAKRIKTECDPKLPIIIATAYDVTEFETQAKEAGIDQIVAKPLFQSTLFDLLVSTYGKYHPVPRQAENQKLRLDGIRVLLVEDNAMNMEIAVEVLQRSGLTVDTAEDGQKAYEKFVESEPGTYQGILMDIQMPVLDGYQATGKIRSSQHPEAKTIPIIAMTANAFAEDIAQALSCGMNDHVSKPIDYDKLFAVLTRFVSANENTEI